MGKHYPKGGRPVHDSSIPEPRQVPRAILGRPLLPGPPVPRPSDKRSSPNSGGSKDRPVLFFLSVSLRPSVLVLQSPDQSTLLRLPPVPPLSHTNPWSDPLRTETPSLRSTTSRGLTPEDHHLSSSLTGATSSLEAPTLRSHEPHLRYRTPSPSVRPSRTVGH